MRVLQVNKYYHPVVGGVEQVVRTLAEGLRGRGHETEVVAATDRGTGRRDHVDGVPVTRVTSPGAVMSVPVAPTFPYRVRQRAAAADIVHYHVPNPLAVGSHLLGAAGSTPTVVTYHSDIVRQSRALRLYRPALERFLDDVDHIVTTSPRLRENSTFLGPRRDRCSVVPLSVDPPGEDDAPADGLVADVDGPVVLTVGRLNYYKGVEYLVEAMADVDATLVVVGDGERRERLQQRAAQLGLRARFPGYVDDATLDAWYDRADVFVLPSVEPSEAFGIVQLEAMAHGVPVVNTDLPTGVPWVSQDGETGLTVPPRDPDALAEALETLLADPQRRATLGANGRRRVRERFTHDRLVDDTLAVYERVLERATR